MLGVLVRRILLGLVTLLVVTILVFVGTSVLPGDVAIAVLGRYATQEALDHLRQSLGLDRPLIVQYLDWLRAMLQGDFGNSIGMGAPVSEIVGGRLWNTLKLSGLAAMFAVPLSIVLGLSAATFPNSAWDRTVSFGTLISAAVPEFFMASVFVMVFSVSFGLLPARAAVPEDPTFWELIHALAMPILTLTAVVSAQMTRMTRAAILNVLSSAYIEMAILKGVPRMRIILEHAFPNAIGPIANVIALNLAYLISGVVIVETIFSYPGLARTIAEAVQTRDMPLIQACAVIFGIFYIALILVADITAILSNPRLRSPK